MRLAFLLVVLVVAPARAAAVDPSAEREARALHEEATRHFHAGDYDRAIAAYKQAYARAAAPALLFNIAQAYRAKRDASNALAYYDAFLKADPSTEERPFVEARMAELRAGVVVTGLGPTTQVSAVSDRPNGAGLRTAGMITAGAGALMTGAGVVFAVQARGRIDRGVMDRDGSAAKAAQTRAIVFTAGGTMAMVVGGVMFYVGSRPVQVIPAVAPGGAGLQVSGAF